MTTIQPERILRRPLYVYDLPQEILSTLQLKLDTNDPEDLIKNNITHSSRGLADLSKLEVDSTQSNNSQKSLTCSLCGYSYINHQEQRNHVRSDLHSYNLKQRMRGLRVVNEAEFEELAGNLDESLSGSENSDSASDSDNGETRKPKGSGTILSILLKKQAGLTDEGEDKREVLHKRKQGTGNLPLIWFTSSALPSDISLGIYRAIFTQVEQQADSNLVEIVRQKQTLPKLLIPLPNDEGRVPLPRPNAGPHIFMCMIGGGHFASMVVSLAPKIEKKQGVDEHQATVLAHKTFHRYTTRRKQGGAQSANDAAKGAAHSAGSSLRRYNEVALEAEIRQLLSEWKVLINSAELLFIRATGTMNRRTLFGPYDGQVLRQDDPRTRGFPFSTRRATQNELMRCFVELTRVKVNQIDITVLAADQAKALADTKSRDQAAIAKAQMAAVIKAVTTPSEVEEAASLHTVQIEALIRRSKAPALLTYLSTNMLSSDFPLFPTNSQAHHHAPTPLHLASSTNSPALVNSLLVKAGADPTILSSEGKTAFEIAGDRVTRDAFRLARSELGEMRWRWDEARIPEPLTRKDVEERTEREKVEAREQEEARRRTELDRIREEEGKRTVEHDKGVTDRREKKMGKGRLLVTPQITAEQRREEESRGMTPEMRMRLEREKRARAAEERMKKTAAPIGARP